MTDFTAYEPLKGKSWETAFSPFGEVVEFQRMTDQKL